jgi:hypothetical protein
MLGGMGDDRQQRGSDRMSDEHDQDQDQADVAGEAADLLDRLRAELDPSDRHDIRGKQADWRLRKAAEVARERAQRREQ